MAASREFRDRYQLVRFDTHGPHDERAIVWVRREDSRVGIERQPDRVVVPGFLFASPRAAGAEFDASGRLGTLLKPGQSSSLSGVAIGPGTWRVSADADGPVALAVGLTPGLLDRTVGSQPLAVVVRSEGESVAATISVQADPPTAVHVRSVTFSR
jgi:hypothetical protein